MEYLKINANNLVFCSAPIKNEKARDFHSNSTDINICRKEVKFYDSLNNDYIYRKFHEYFKLISKQINWYYHQNNKKYKDESTEIGNLLNKLKEDGYLDIIFDVTNKKYINSDHCLNYLAVNSYYACKYNYKRRNIEKYSPIF
ncbi:MAG: hypothetical protein ACI4T1_04685 [Christensenellales bacterium]